MIEAAVAAHGCLDILVNNAGYGIAGTVVTTSEADWDALMAVNVKGVFFGCKYAIPVMEKQGGGAIVNTASGAAHVGIVNRAAYVASKGAVDALTRAMATDHALTGIRINAVAPGTIETPYFAEIFAKSPNAAGLRRGLEMRQAMERLGKPIGSRAPCCSWRAMRPRSAPARRWSSTGAGRRRAIDSLSIRVEGSLRPCTDCRVRKRS